MGALFDAVSHSIKEESSVRFDGRPRMADFARIGCAAAPALGWTAESFLHAYANNRQCANSVSLEGSAIAAAILELLDLRFQWGGTASELLEELNNGFGDSRKKPRYWPESARGVSNALRRLATNFRRAGIEVVLDKRESGTGRRLIHLEKLGNLSSQPSHLGTSPLFTRNLGRDDSDDSDARIHPLDGELWEEGAL